MLNYQKCVVGVLLIIVSIPYFVSALAPRVESYLWLENEKYKHVSDYALRSRCEENSVQQTCLEKSSLKTAFFVPMDVQNITIDILSCFKS